MGFVEKFHKHIACHIHFFPPKSCHLRDNYTGNITEVQRPQRIRSHVHEIFMQDNERQSRFRCPCDLRRRSAAIHLLGLEFVSCVCCVGSGPCEELIICSGESYQAFVCDLETSKNAAAQTRVLFLCLRKILITMYLTLVPSYFINYDRCGEISFAVRQREVGNYAVAFPLLRSAMCVYSRP